MKPGHDSQDAYKDLLKRAAVYFRQLLLNSPQPERHEGARAWLNDFEEAELWELIENYQALEFIRDDSDPLDVPL